MKKKPAEPNKYKAFLIAYEKLEEACYIPEKFREAYENFIQKVNIPSSKAPTNIRLLQFKINLDARLRYSTEQIYRLLDLKDPTE